MSVTPVTTSRFAAALPASWFEATDWKEGDPELPEIPVPEPPPVTKPPAPPATTKPPPPPPPTTRPPTVPPTTRPPTVPPPPPTTRPPPPPPPPVARPPPPVTRPPVPRPPSGGGPGVGVGPHTGRLVARLPLEDLRKPRAGAWNGTVKWKKSGLTTVGGAPALRVFFKKGSGTSGMPFADQSGMAITSRHPAIAGQRAVVVGFDLMFDAKAWHFSRGGKIGGLFVGPGKASGYRHSPDGASHRMMWQDGGAAISYIYPPSGMRQEDPKLKPEGHGVGYFERDKFPKGTLKPGRWHRVEIGVKVNSFAGGRPNPDGVSVLTIDGVSGVVPRVRWAAKPNIVIDNLGLSFFFGGPSPAVVDSVLYVRNVDVFAWKD